MQTIKIKIILIHLQKDYKFDKKETFREDGILSTSDDVQELFIYKSYFQSIKFLYMMHAS